MSFQRSLQYSIALVIANVLIGLIAHGANIIFLPIVIIACTSTIFLANNEYDIFKKAIALYFILAAQDILNRFIYLALTGDNVDFEGEAWNLALSAMGIAPSILIIIGKSIFSKEVKLSKRIITPIIFTLMFIIHFGIFQIVIHTIQRQ